MRLSWTVIHSPGDTSIRIWSSGPSGFASSGSSFPDRFVFTSTSVVVEALIVAGGFVVGTGVGAIVVVDLAAVVLATVAVGLSAATVAVAAVVVDLAAVVLATVAVVVVVDLACVVLDAVAVVLAAVAAVVASVVDLASVVLAIVAVVLAAVVVDISPDATVDAAVVVVGVVVVGVFCNRNFAVTKNCDRVDANWFPLSGLSVVRPKASVFGLEPISWLQNSLNAFL